MKALEMKSVSVIRQDRLILNDINLTINEGETTVIIGRTGSGKSTLLKVLAGLIPYEKGKVLYNGTDIGSMDEKTIQAMQNQTGFMFQDSALWANMSLFDNLTLPLIVKYPNILKRELNELVSDALASMNFNLSPEIRPAAISAGERKIISFLRAVISDPPILFLDDPTTSIDRRSFRNLGGYIDKFKKARKTMVIVTENPLYAKTLSDKLILIRRGEILMEGTYRELSTSENPHIKRFFEDF